MHNHSKAYTTNQAKQKERKKERKKEKKKERKPTGKDSQGRVSVYVEPHSK